MRSLRFLPLLLPLLLLRAPAREVASHEIPAAQEDATDFVNARLTATVRRAVEDALKRTRTDPEKAVHAVFKAMVFPLTKRSIASIELAMERDPDVRPLLNFGKVPEGERDANGAWAPTLRLRKEEADLCVGLDKFGHFFEEGYVYYQIVKEFPEDGEKRAEGFGRWLEGQRPDDGTLAWIYRTKKMDLWWTDPEGKREYSLIESFGAHTPGKELGLENGSSPADLEANAQGLRFYQWLSKTMARAPRSGPVEGFVAQLKVDIREYLNEKWDERKNPNVKRLEERPAPGK